MKLVPLKDCPPGPFLYNGSLGFKTDYNTSDAEAYCFETGEYFWGGANTHQEKLELLVQPLDPEIFLKQTFIELVKE